MNEDLDLLRRAVEEPVPQMLLAEVASPTHAREVARQLRAWIELARPLAELSFDANKADAGALWEQSHKAVAEWDEDEPGLLLVRDESPPHVRIEDATAQKPTSIGFWRTMNQLREKWDALPTQTIFLVTHEQYFFLTTEADHFKRWIPLKLHLPGPEEPTSRRAGTDFSHAPDESPGVLLMLDNLEDQEAARQNWETYHERLRYACERGESPQTLARRHYLPLMAAAITLQKWQEATNYNALVSQAKLSEPQRLRWLRLRAYLEEAQGNIAQAIATAEERLRFAEEFEKREVEVHQKQQELPWNTLSALNDLYLLHKRLQNLDEAEHWILQALRFAPNFKVFLGNYAFFLHEVRRDYEKAEEFYQRAVEADPQDAYSLSRYASFLASVRQDYEKAEEFYQRAVEADPQDAYSLSRYASFLASVRQDYEKAEEFYQRAVEADPQDADILGNYAVFLCLTRHDFEQAEIYFRRATETAPYDPQYAINYAAFLLIQGQKDEGQAMLEKAAAMPGLSDAQQVGIAFHRAIHFPADSPSPLRELKRVLKAGKRAEDWNFDLNIERTRQEGPFNVALLEALAAVITEDKDLKSLDDFDEWRAA